MNLLIDLIPNNIGKQTFEITKPYSDDQHTGTTGYGEGVAGSLGLVVLTAKVGTTDKQTVSYGGFPVGSVTDSTGNFVDSITHTDLYGAGNNQNFRLKFRI